MFHETIRIATQGYTMGLRRDAEPLRGRCGGPPLGLVVGARMGTVRFGSELDATGFDLLASQPHSWLEAAEMNRRAASILGAVAMEDIAAMSNYINSIADSPPG